MYNTLVTCWALAHKYGRRIYTVSPHLYIFKPHLTKCAAIRGYGVGNFQDRPEIRPGRRADKIAELTLIAGFHYRFSDKFDVLIVDEVGSDHRLST